MDRSLSYGSYSRGFITDIPADLSSPQANYFRQTLPKFPEEGIYIYSFKENRMLYADGWEEVVGYKDQEITMLGVVNMTAPSFTSFVNELNDKALMFIHNKCTDLEKYSFTIELKIV